MTGLHETTEQTMVMAHRSGTAYWRANRTHDANRADLEQLARTLGWHGEDNIAWIAGYYGAKRRATQGGI